MQEVHSSKYLLSQTPKRGLIRIVQIQNDKTLLVASEDIQKDIVKIRFQLDMETFPHKELQDEYTRIGLELFSIDPYLVVEDANADLNQILDGEKEKLRGKTLLY